MIVPNAAVACPYRVGDYLFSENATHPSTSWPGTSWVQVQGRMILGASKDYPVGSEGGEAEHTLTLPETPSHAHYEQLDFSGFGVRNLAASPGTGEGSGKVFSPDNTGSSTSEYYVQTATAGGGQAHNNLPPYRAAYIWRRTA